MRKTDITTGAPLGGVSALNEIGSAGRIRTYDQPVNSRLLYR